MTFKKRPGRAGLCALVALSLVAAFAAGRRAVSAPNPQRLDPAAWGSDHVGQPVPDYATGDECLFCHREKVGTTWARNRHNLTIRPSDDQSPAITAVRQSEAKEFAADIKYLLGNQRRQRFLRPAKAYGKLDLLSVEWMPAQQDQPGKLISITNPHWDADRFANSCAGCHTTAVDPNEKTFSAIALDCYVCHGNVPAEHANKPQLAYLSPKKKDEARVVTSICAQCHIRSGKAKSTDRAYPTNFVAGDNLFRDFQVPFGDEAVKDLSIADRHVVDNVRDVVLLDKTKVTCLSCHIVHGQSGKKHHLVAKSDYCWTCHEPGETMRLLKPFSTHSSTCGY